MPSPAGFRSPATRGITDRSPLPNHGMSRGSFGLYARRPNDISPLCNVRVPLKTDSRSRWG